MFKGLKERGERIARTSQQTDQPSSLGGKRKRKVEARCQPARLEERLQRPSCSITFRAT